MVLVVGVAAVVLALALIEIESEHDKVKEPPCLLQERFIAIEIGKIRLDIRNEMRQLRQALELETEQREEKKAWKEI